MAESKKNYQNIKITSLKNSEVEIAGEISAEKLEACKEKAIKNLSKEIEIPGFRKGHVPASVISQKLGEMGILEEAAEIALGEEYPNILIDNKIDAIGRPEISLTKLASGNPIGFKIKTAVMPEVKIAEYKKIAKEEMAKEEKIEVTDKEIDEVILQIRKNKAHEEYHKNNPEDKEHNHAEIKDEDLPIFDDDFAKSLGDFKSVDDIRSKIKENLVKEKELRSKDKKRMEMADELVKKTEVVLPEIIIKSELEKMFAQFKDDIARAGLTVEEYLKHIKKTEEDIRKEWAPDAEKKAKMQLILNKIAVEEKIEADPREVEKEVEALLKIYADADKERAKIYVETMIMNEKVFQFLENQK